MNEQKEIRVLHVFGSLGVGGAETWLMALLKYFRDAGDSLPARVRTDVCLTGGETSVFDEQASGLGALLHYSKYSRNNLPEFTRQFRELLGNGNYHVVHDHQDHTAGVYPSVSYVNRYVRRIANSTVQFGPFKGMRLDKPHSAPVMFLVDTYERELHSARARLRQRRFKRVLDVGASNGYYAVGTALWENTSEVVAWEAEDAYHSQSAPSRMGSRSG